MQIWFFIVAIVIHHILTRWAYCVSVSVPCVCVHVCMWLRVLVWKWQQLPLSILYYYLHTAIEYLCVYNSLICIYLALTAHFRFDFEFITEFVISFYFSVFISSFDTFRTSCVNSFSSYRFIWKWRVFVWGWDTHKCYLSISTESSLKSKKKCSSSIA